MILFASGTVCALARINVTRSIKNDKFTNPNRTAVSKCHSSTKVSSFDTCRTFGSMNTRAVCISSSRCCESCQCVSSYPSYLPRLSKCVSLYELNSDIFGPGSKGCSSRLEIEGQGGGDDDDDDDDKNRDGKDDDDDDDDKKDVCKVTSWNPPVVDFQNPSSSKIKICGKKDVDSCDLVRVQSSAPSPWQNISNFKQTLWGSKIEKGIFLKWDKVKASKLSGNLIVVHLKCKQKKNGYFSTCLIFKSAGTQIVIPLQSTTTTAITVAASTMVATKTTGTLSSSTVKRTLKSILTTTKRAARTSSKPVTVATAKPKSDIVSASTPNKAHEFSSPPSTQTTSDVKPSEPIEPTEPTEPTSGGKRSVDKSYENSGKELTFTIVGVISALLVLSALSVTVICFLKKRKAGKGIPEDTRSKTRFDDQGTEPYKPDDLVYESQSNAYELLQRDGKSENWEQPEYQALTKREDTGGLSIGELYSNPSMYQDLKHNVKTSGTDSPVYHALVKQQQHTTEDYPEYECGYLVLRGEHDNINH